MNGKAALLWQEHRLHRLHHFLCDGQLIEGECLLDGDNSEIQTDYLLINGCSWLQLTSDLGVHKRDIGTVKMSEALHDFLYSHEGNLTVAIPSCSLMDMTTPMLPRTPLPTTCRVKTPKTRQELQLLKAHIEEN